MKKIVLMLILWLGFSLPVLASSPTIVLSPQECSQTAAIVATYQQLALQPDFKFTPEFKEMLASTTANAKAVANHIINNSDFGQTDPGALFQYLQEVCFAAEGKTTLPVPTPI